MQPNLWITIQVPFKPSLVGYEVKFKCLMLPMSSMFYYIYNKNYNITMFVEEVVIMNKVYFSLSGVLHGFGSHFLASRRRMELVKSPHLHFPTCNKLVANQYHFWKTTFVPVPLMRKNEVILHLFSYVFKLVAMNVKDWLSTLKHI